MKVAKPLLLLPALALGARAETPWPRAEVDRGVELVSVVGALAAESGGKGFAFGTSAYGRRARERFARFAGHPAVQKHAEAARAGFDPVDALHVILQTDARLRASRPLREYERRAGGREKLNGWLASLDAFARDASFDDFFSRERPSYDRALRRLARERAGRDDAAPVAAYTGLDPSSVSYRLVLCLLCTERVAANLVLADPPSAASVLGPAGQADGEPRFDWLLFRGDLWHELAHGLLDAEAERHGAALARSAGLSGGREPCYGSWPDCVREHVARGVASRVAVSLGIDLPLSAGRPGPLPHDREFERLFKEYERSRRKYPTLASFYPRLVEGLAEAAAKGARR